MKLKKVRIQNFRSIEDSGIFTVDDLTCLVGKNEAGKTALLQALHALRPYNSALTKLDVTQEYPRRFVTKYAERHSGEEAEVVWTEWELSGAAKVALERAFGSGVLNGDSVSISKTYNQAGTSWTVPLDERRVVENLLTSYGPNAAEKQQFGTLNSTALLASVLEKIDSRTPKQQELLDRISKYRSKSAILHAIDILNEVVPKFFFTSHYDRMSGQISVNQIQKDEEEEEIDSGDEIFLEFLQLAGTSLDDLKDSKKFEDLQAKLEAASNEITQQIFQYWTQNDALEVKLAFSEGRPEDPEPFDEGTVIRARVWNALHGASVPFSERSAGFVWFFSFLVQFAAMRRETGNVIILLDEPGLTLHGKAQADLLRYIENELLPHHQVLFTTHSPFMVPAHNFASVRIVEDVIRRSDTGRPLVEGTKVRDDVLVTNRDTLFPLQGALGYDIAQSLFVGHNTLLVEGPSDILYLQALSGALRSLGREGLSSQWTLCPSGGIDKIRPFVSLFGGNKLNVAVLSDQAKGDRQKIEKLKRSEILSSTQFYTVADFLDVEEADVEDIFDPALFCAIVNASYNLPKKLAITPKGLASAEEGVVRQVKQAEALFRLMPSSIPEFNHFTPASWLIQHPEMLEFTKSGVSDTLERAEEIFRAYNKLIVFG